MRRQGWDGWPLTELLLQRQDQVLGQHSDAVFFALAVAQEHLVALELDVFDAQPQTFGWLAEKDGRVGSVLCFHRNLDRLLQEHDHSAVGVSGAADMGMRLIGNSATGHLDCAGRVARVGVRAGRTLTTRAG